MRRKGELALIRYALRLADLARHLFVVECTIDVPEPVQDLRMPSWIPGSYLLREFARHVVAIDALSGGRKIPVEKLDKSGWRCVGAEAQLTVTATIYALDESVRGAYLDRRRGFFNGACLFLMPEGRSGEPAEMTLSAPDDPAAAAWRVATAMPAVDVDARGFGRYRAADYDELIDHPVEIGDFASIQFDAASVPHRLIVAGHFESDLERVAGDLRQLCETEVDFFGRPAPFASYSFLTLAVGSGYGGLEHRASSSLMCNRDDLPKVGEPGTPKEYQRFLALAAHEYFHAWHVKRTKPAAFMPYRLDRRNHTRLLWVFEGITTYYQDLLLLRSGLVGVKAYLRRLGELVTRVYRTPGRFRQSIAAASFDAWDHLYKPDANTPNAGVSYYAKGALTALALDLTLRSLPEPAVSLDDVVRELWGRYGARGIGVPEEGFERLAEDMSGGRLGNFFACAVRGTEDLPLADLLRRFALTLHLRARAGLADSGGTPEEEGAPGVDLGAAVRARDEGLELVAVLDGTAAQRAGLNPGDVLIALGGLRVDERTLKQRLQRFEPGERIRAAAFRGDELLEVEIELAPPVRDTAYVEIDAAAATDAAERRRAWLGE